MGTMNNLNFLDSFKTENFARLNDNEKIEAYQKLENYMAQKQGRRARTVFVDEEMSPDLYGGYNAYSNDKIALNPSSLEPGNQFEGINTTIHEGIHARQQDYIDSNDVHRFARFDNEMEKSRTALMAENTFVGNRTAYISGTEPGTGYYDYMTGASEYQAHKVALEEMEQDEFVSRFGGESDFNRVLIGQKQELINTEQYAKEKATGKLLDDYSHYKLGVTSGTDVGESERNLLKSAKPFMEDGENLETFIERSGIDDFNQASEDLIKYNSLALSECSAEKRAEYCNIAREKAQNYSQLKSDFMESSPFDMEEYCNNETLERAEKIGLERESIQEAYESQQKPLAVEENRNNDLQNPNGFETQATGENYDFKNSLGDSGMEMIDISDDEGNGEEGNEGNGTFGPKSYGDYPHTSGEPKSENLEKTGDKVQNTRKDEPFNQEENVNSTNGEKPLGENQNSEILQNGQDFESQSNQGEDTPLAQESLQSGQKPNEESLENQKIGNKSVAGVKPDFNENNNAQANYDNFQAGQKPGSEQEQKENGSAGLQSGIKPQDEGKTGSKEDNLHSDFDKDGCLIDNENANAADLGGVKYSDADDYVKGAVENGADEAKDMGGMSL